MVNPMLMSMHGIDMHLHVLTERTVEEPLRHSRTGRGAGYMYRARARALNNGYEHKRLNSRAGHRCATVRLAIGSVSIRPASRTGEG